jgi:hypothetical protein
MTKQTLQKLRAEIQRLAASTDLKVLAFIKRMVDRYQELKSS